VNGEQVKDVEEFPYLGATVHKESEGVKIVRSDWGRRAVHFRVLERCGQPEE